MGWVAGRPFSVETDADDVLASYFALPHVLNLRPYWIVYVPWVWVVMGYGGVTWVMWRWTRVRRVVGAFEVERVGKAEG